MIMDCNHINRSYVADCFGISDDPSFVYQRCSECATPHDMLPRSLEELENDRQFASSCLRTAELRFFFTTDSKHVGFDSTSSIPGDKVFLLLGSQTPFVLV